MRLHSRQALCAPLLLALCATVMAATQAITVDAVDANGVLVSDAVCDVTNRNGAWRVVTPAVAQITASGPWITVKCVKGLALSGSATSIDTSALGPTRATVPPGTLRELGGIASARVRVVMRDKTGAAPPPAAPVDTLVVQAAPMGAAVTGAPLAASARSRTRTPDPSQATHATASTPGAMPAAAAWSPTPKTVADFYDVTAVPYLSESGRMAYRDFLVYPLPRAFAVSRNGGWGFGVRGTDPRKLALDNCERRGGPCQIYALDQQVVWASTR